MSAQAEGFSEKAIRKHEISNILLYIKKDQVHLERGFRFLKDSLLHELEKSYNQHESYHNALCPIYEHVTRSLNRIEGIKNNTRQQDELTTLYQWFSVNFSYALESELAYFSAL